MMSPLQLSIYSRLVDVGGQACLESTCVGFGTHFEVERVILRDGAHDFRGTDGVRDRKWTIPTYDSPVSAEELVRWLRTCGGPTVLDDQRVDLMSLPEPEESRAALIFGPRAARSKT